MRSVASLAAAALLLSAISFASPAERPPALGELQTAAVARIEAIDALATPTKKEKAERKWLGKATDALALYQGVNDKADLKKGLSKATSSLRRSKCVEPAVTAQFPALRSVFVDIVDPTHADATSKLAQLSKAKHVKLVRRLITQAEKKQAKADEKWTTRMDKGATLYVAAILKLQKAIEKARKYGAVDTVPIDVDSSALTLVLDATGQPVANALVGGSQLTDKNGVAVGAIDVSAAGWATVSSTGFATGYATSISTVGESEFYVARITPFAGLVPLDSGESKLLQVGDENGAWAETTVGASQLASVPATVGLTQISPLDVGPLFEPVPGHADHWLRLAFAIDRERGCRDLRRRLTVRRTRARLVRPVRGRLGRDPGRMHTRECLACELRAPALRRALRAVRTGCDRLRQGREDGRGGRPGVPHRAGRARSSGPHRPGRGR
jgi:hypothetical protein